MQGKVEICGVNTSRLPVLKNEEAQALLERAKAGDKAAREELISGNLRLVLSVIQKFSGRGAPALRGLPAAHLFPHQGAL